TMSMGSTVFAKDVTDKSTTEVTKDGTSNDMTLKGTVGEPGADLISVVLPSSINFQIGTDDAGKFKNLITSTGTITNNSTIGVKIELAEVKDNGGLLGLVDLALAPKDEDSATVMTTYKLSAPLATPVELATNLEKDGTLSLKVFGQKNDADGEIAAGEYNVVTTLKVTAVPKADPAPVE
uniref:hypothetical protein n=1 Tax=Anaerolentibacter hominis TaxID=3079009 RepID=UPI0031B7F2B9